MSSFKYPSIEYLRTQFDLSSDGTLVNRVTRGSSVLAGQVAGTINKQGYSVVSVKRKLILAHRVVYALTHNEWPKGQIDHIDGVRLNNCPSNLRDVSSAVNTRNTRTSRSNNKLGVLGVSMAGNKFHARITVDGRLYLLGNYSSLDEARAAYSSAKRQHHPEAFTYEQ